MSKEHYLKKKIFFRNYIRSIIYILLITFINQMGYLILEYFDFKDTLRKIIVCAIIFEVSIFASCISFWFEKNNSYIDILTGVYNRKKLYIDLKKMIKNDLKFVCVFIDLDNFKTINDSYGHKAGDKVLKSFSKTASTIDSSVECYRFGGDEFILISKDTENFQKIIDDFITKYNKFEFSYGVSSYPEDTVGYVEEKEIVEKLLSVADKKMYINKKEGKNEM